jgi:P27 family predicted phage terminase small subunit
MSKQERSKKSTVSNQVLTAQMVSTKIDPPEPLSDRRRTHFDAIVKSRETSTWSPHDIRLAVNLAIALDRLDQVNLQLDAEGLMSESGKGTPIAHPLLPTLMSAASQVRQLSATLGLTASQRGVAGSKQSGRNAAEIKAREVIEKAAEDDLLA